MYLIVKKNSVSWQTASNRVCETECGFSTINASRNELKSLSSIAAESWGTQTCVSLWEPVQRPPMCVSWWSTVQRGRWRTSSWMTISRSRGPSGSRLPLTSLTEWTTYTVMDSFTLDWTPVIAWWTIDGRWKLQVRHWGTTRELSDWSWLEPGSHLTMKVKTWLV